MPDSQNGWTLFMLSSSLTVAYNNNKKIPAEKRVHSCMKEDVLVIE